MNTAQVQPAQSSGVASRAPVSGAYKVDISRGKRIGRVSSEWFSRPDDERYLSLSTLYEAVRTRSLRRSRQHSGRRGLPAPDVRSLRVSGISGCLQCRARTMGSASRGWPAIARGDRRLPRQVGANHGVRCWIGVDDRSIHRHGGAQPAVDLCAVGQREDRHATVLYEWSWTICERRSGSALIWRRRAF